MTWPRRNNILSIILRLLIFVNNFCLLLFIISNEINYFIFINFGLSFRLVLRGRNYFRVFLFSVSPGTNTNPVLIQIVGPCVTPVRYHSLGNEGKQESK